MNISMIVAHGKNREIGRNNQLLWYIPEELKTFRTVTQGNILVMGRSTWESINKPLPNREIFVLTNQTIESNYPSVQFGNTEQLEEYFQTVPADKQVFIAGGEQIYRLFLHDPRLAELYVSEIPAEFADADAFFPSFDEALFEKSVFKESNEFTTYLYKRK